MNKTLCFCIAFLVMRFGTFSQELRAEISINTSQIQGSVNRQIFDQLQKAIFEFMNQTRWTTETFAPQERIECSFFLTIKESSGTDDYSGSIQVSARRPVYKSSYYTQILNVEDDKFQFKFQQFSQLEFNINTFQNNLTSVLAYYAYVVIATDYDSFAPQGGTQYWQKAQQIANNAQNARESGWSSSGTDNKNRFWLVENTLQPVFKGIRDCMYEYCRNGLDIMHSTPDEGRTAILKSLDLLKPVAQTRPASYNMQMFFNAKRDEVINIFKDATPEDKTKVLETLAIVDPAGTTKYAQITENGSR
jgi:hypothetical protein